MLYSLKNDEKKYYTKEDVEQITLEIKNNVEIIEELDFTSNVFKPEAMSEICKYISLMNNLKTIILDEIFTTLTKEEMLDCFRQVSLALKGKELILLDLSNNALSSELPKEFINLLSNLNSLKFLKLRNCGLGQKGGDIIGECISKLSIKDNLEYLDIAQNRFFFFPEKLCDGVMTLQNLSVLKLEYNTIEKFTMTKALKVLKNHPLEILDIRDNFLDVEGCRILGEIFATWDVRELMMGDCLAHNEGILEFIRHANKKFSSMTLPGNCKEDIEFVIDISHNDWEQECIDELIDFCKKYCIKKLYITGNLYDDESELEKAMKMYGGELICSEVEFEEDNKSDIDDTLVEMIKQSGNLPYRATSHPNLTAFRRHKLQPIRYKSMHSTYKKTALDYLKEVAKKESDRIQKTIYEKNSFSSESINAKKLKDLRRQEKEDINKPEHDFKKPEHDSKKSERDSKKSEHDVIFYPKEKRREYRKKTTRKNVVIIDPLSNEGEGIESFADFSDSMFKSKNKGEGKMYCCANPDCDVELPSLSRIKRHFLVHTNLKPFKCLGSRCTKRFSRKDNMLQHYRTHCKNKRS